MYIESPKDELSFADLIRAAEEKTCESKSFPYKYHVCRCRNCAYCYQGKCALKRCCCMRDRVKARSCTFSEVLGDCFSNIGDSIFHFRLRLATERAREMHSCFLDSKHRMRFYEGCALTRRYESSFIAQLFLLSASEDLWKRVKEALSHDGVSYAEVYLDGLTIDEYIYFSAACDFEYGCSHASISDLSNDEVIEFEPFRLICYAIAIYIYGSDVVPIAERDRERVRKKRRVKRCE